SRTSLPDYTASERSTLYLLSPNPNDPEYQKRPGAFLSELHDRLSAPLYALFFAILPVAALGQAQTTRQGRSLVVLGTIAIATGVRIGGLILASLAANDSRLIPALYALPLGFIVLSLIAVYSSFRFSASDSIASMATEFVQRIANRFRIGPRPSAGGRT
ncbi:MAG TPA: LptF/LptG family permease, partial [Kaistia sp.]|nr:LptF/LptG family permease [Kaistia sp.]